MTRKTKSTQHFPTILIVKVVFILSKTMQKSLTKIQYSTTKYIYVKVHTQIIVR